MSYLKRPYDRETAHDIMKKFSGLAYSLVNKSIFQEAVNILYGPEFQVTVDLSKRMQFSCQICNREMNSETAMKEHNNSGGHQKNLDKKGRAQTGFSSFNIRSKNYAEDSIHFRLLNSKIAPLGLQMIEEYINRKGNIYYKCLMCGAHGKLEIMYQHIIGKKHTERYIKSCCVLENSILNPNERETLRQELVKDEGVNVDAIKTIKGDEYYPYKWEREGISSTMFNRTIKREPVESNGLKIKYEGGSSLKYKKERRSSSNSPTPGPSRGRSRSISPARSFYSKTPSRSRDYSSRSPSSRLYGRSPSWRRQSRSPSWRRQSRSPSRRRESPSPSQQRSSRWSRSSSSSSEMTRLPSPKEKKPEVPQISVRSLEDLSAYRNRSPSPPVRVKQEPVSPPPRVKEEPLSPTASPDYRNSVKMPVPLSAIKKEKSDATIQTKLNLEMEMMHLNDYIKTFDDKPLRSPEEAKLAIETLNCYANTIRGVVMKTLEDGTAKSPEKMRMLQFQKEKIEKVIGYTTKWYLPTWKKELQNL